MFEGFYKWHEARKIVAVICIAHNNILALRCFNSFSEGIPITLFFHMNHAHPHRLGNGDGAIRAPIIRDENLSFDLIRAQKVPRLDDTGGERFCLIKTGHNDRYQGVLFHKFCI